MDRLYQIIHRVATLDLVNSNRVFSRLSLIHKARVFSSRVDLARIIHQWDFSQMLRSLIIVLCLILIRLVLVIRVILIQQIRLRTLLALIHLGEITKALISPVSRPTKAQLNSSPKPVSKQVSSRTTNLNNSLASNSPSLQDLARHHSRQLHRQPRTNPKIQINKESQVSSPKTNRIFSLYQINSSPSKTNPKSSLSSLVPIIQPNNKSNQWDRLLANPRPLLNNQLDFLAAKTKPNKSPSNHSHRLQ